MQIIENSNIDKGKWQNLLENSSFTSPFQTPKYYEFFQSIDNFSADVFAVEHNGKYSALVVVTTQKEKGLKSFFSRRAIIYGGPLLSQDEDALNALLKKINTFYKGKVIYLEVRNYFDYTKYKDVFETNGFKYVPWLNFHLDASDEAKMKKQMSSSRRRQIKKAVKSGAEWQVADNEKDVESFYIILKDLYENKIKKPLFPKEFFIEFFKQEIGKYLLVYYEGKVIGGIMCPLVNKKAIYEYYVCGLDQEYKNQYPSVMATWAAMEYAHQNDIPVFDFMGAGNPDESYGVREFKSRFGGKQVEHGRYLKIMNPFLYKVGVVGLKLLSIIKK